MTEHVDKIHCDPRHLKRIQTSRRLAKKFDESLSSATSVYPEAREKMIELGQVSRSCPVCAAAIEVVVFDVGRFPPMIFYREYCPNVPS